jgi:hypothetical protein
MHNLEKLRKADADALKEAASSYEASYVSLLARCLEAGAFRPCEAHDRAREIFASVREDRRDALDIAKRVA